MTVTSGSVTATLSGTTWATGYCNDITIANAGAAITNWSLKLTSVANISSIWNTTPTNGSTATTLNPSTNPNNASIAANSSITLGFCGTGTTRPTLASLTVTGGGSGGATVQLGQTKQKMDGFGISDVWASAALTDAQADKLFDATKGIGLSILRIGMQTDGTPLGSAATSDIQKAKARGVTNFIGSVWSAPANCKTNNNVNDGGHLLTSCYESWANTITKFATAMKPSGGTFAMSLANEPDFASCGLAKPCNGNYASMLYTSAEMVAFAKVAAPKLKAAGIKVIAPEPAEWNHLWTNNSAAGSTDPLKGTGYDYGHALYKDTVAWNAIDIIGTHQYDSQVAQAWPTDVSQTKTLYMTEMSGIKWWPEAGPSTDIANGVVVAGWIHDAIVNGPAAAWLYWSYQAQYTDDNEGLILKNGTDTKRHYTLGNYSKFVRPGYTRVAVGGTVPANVLLSAYRGADGTVVVVAINKGTASVTLPIAISGGTTPTAITPWVTSASDNLVAKAPLSVSGGSFTSTLAGKTVTTFVGK
jgi:glucuronoarabinoxylan endo-1,4-beta-xylanase